MLELIVDKQMIYVLMGIFAVIGVVSKCVSDVTLKQLVKAAGNMSKSTHPLMRLVRAKFEHACMVSEKVENVHVFVDKYLYEYKVMGVRLYSLRRMETISAVVCLILGLAGAFLTYLVNGMTDAVIQMGAAGGILAVLLYLFHFTTDEEFRLTMAKNYMVDYLENVCLHRYEKAYRGRAAGSQKEEPVAVKHTEEPVAATRSAVTELEAKEDIFDKKELDEEDFFELVEEFDAEEDFEYADVRRIDKSNRQSRNRQEIRPEANKISEKKQPVKMEQKQEKPDREVLIRQILEEFMA